ncbi:Clp1/GlmU family protein [Nitrosomonas sp. Nm166]|uniref:Clp1/GlmU family protein n=1 Tax=Nitrosomonas sp. Nm166 TaxID=1881054 RepID=UPI0008F199F0|nr:Clp1/GlmU family protein [Nitrosomonas sp. Nm166]SFE66691.1 Ribonuclease BN, tRNA processing enzyme [Nitrosomonas sp. Nm166]
MHARDTKPDLPTLAYCAVDIANIALKQKQRILLHGPPGTGKSTLAAQLAHELEKATQSCYCLCADPGSPAFGLPGTVSLARWQLDGWQVCTYEAICSLDAGRFRLPLVLAVRRLMQSQTLDNSVLLIDTPGVVRGVAGSELLQGLFEVVAADAVLALTAADRPPALLDELRTLTTQLYVVHASPEARRPGKRNRARQRTQLWDSYLENNIEHTLDLDQLNIIGTPPPLGEASSWIGRQVALLNHNQTQLMAEVRRLQGNQLTVRLPFLPQALDSLLVRNAQRSVSGLMETAIPFAAEPIEYRLPPDTAEPSQQNGGQRIMGRVGPVDFCLVNGILGDPLLHVRLRQQRRSLLFDLGEGMRLPARIAHQVTDVFITHAHIDHIGGFMMLLRSRIGQFPPCRLYGPPGLAQHIAGFLQGILWDRVAERAPCFEVAELHADRLLRFRLRAGHKTAVQLDEVKLQAGIILQDTGFRIRAQLLDHHTPVLAYAFEPTMEINIRKDILQARGWKPGPWLAILKNHLLAENDTAIITLPDGTVARVADIAADLTLIKPGKKLVYATDLADTPDNRQRLQSFAQYAHTFFCEARFIEADAEQAARTGHLTTRACGEIAMAAEVARLVPFHFSQRYPDKLQQIYDEVYVACSRVVIPPSLQHTAVTNHSALVPGN